MKRMGSVSTEANRKAVAFGRDMLKRPSQKKIDGTASAVAAEGGSITGSVSMSAFGNGAAPRSGLACSKPTLKDSFTLFLQNQPREEISEMTNQILAAVNKTREPINKGNDTFSPLTAPPTTRGGRRKGSANRRRSASINNADLPMNWTGYYQPISTSRRNSSREGAEVAASMKLNAQKLLQELGEITDDSDDDDDFLLKELDVVDEKGVSLEPVKFGD